MYISKHMKVNPVTVGKDTLIYDAKKILDSKHFRHLPVVDEQGTMVGVVTDRDIRSAYPSTIASMHNLDEEMEKVNKTPIEQIMSRDVKTLTKFSTLDDALLLLDHHKVGALPVLDENGKVVGIFSIRDLIFSYKELFGLGEKGSALVAIKGDNKPRPLSRIIHALENNDIHFSRVIRKKDTDGGMVHDLIYIRVNTMNIRAVHKVLEKVGFEIDFPVFATE